MAEEEEEQTEEPTEKKISDAREKGNVPKSMEVSGLSALIVGLAVLFLAKDFIGERLTKLYIYYSNFIGVELTKNLVFEIALITFRELAITILIVAVPIMIAGVVGTVSQFGFIFSTEPITPKLEKINPINGLKQLFSLKKVMEAIKITLKVAVSFGIGFFVFLLSIKELPTVALFNLYDQLDWLLENAILLVVVMIVTLLVFALIDLVLVRYQYFKNLRMSKQEIKDEYKNMEGNPEIKAKIRQIQYQMSRKRMLAEVPNADVVVRNPTHYAVALKYNNQKSGSAPKVVAKGADFLAQRIIQIALEHDVPVVENKPLAQELYKSVDVGREIPQRLFQAVAEVLAYVYKISKKGKR